ncbi:unnamed protein product [Schistosoma haematobium]|nr:unnamed protein product [Schistosoma haematobium]
MHIHSLIIIITHEQLVTIRRIQLLVTVLKTLVLIRMLSRNFRLNFTVLTSLHLRFLVMMISLLSNGIMRYGMAVQVL